MNAGGRVAHPTQPETPVTDQPNVPRIEAVPPAEAPPEPRHPWAKERQTPYSRMLRSCSDKFGGFSGGSKWKNFLDYYCRDIRIRKLPIRSSYIADLRRCPRLFLYRVRLGLRRKGSFSHALSVGTYYHSMMQHSYEGCTPPIALTHVAEECRRVRLDIEAAADSSGLLPNARPVERAVLDNEQAYSLAQVMYLLSYDRFLGAPFLTQEAWEVIAVEQPLELRYRGLAAPIRCKPDAVLRRPRDGAILIDNHKTTSRSIQQLATAYSFAVQPRIEALCVRTAFPDAPAYYYRHNVIRKPTIKYPTKNSPTFEDYLTNCHSWYEDQAALDAQNPPIAMSLRLLVGPAMDEELHCLLDECSRACTLRADHVRYYRDDHSCMGPYGNSPCPYLPLCTTDPSCWPQTIEDQYEQAWREDEEDPDAVE